MWLLRALQLRSSIRSGARSSVRLLSVALLCSMLMAGGLIVARPSVAHANGVGTAHSIKDYLALGDSVTFGFDPLVNPANPANFIGYPDVVASTMGLRLTNAACPGATSSYFVSLAGPDFLCIPFRSNSPLHVNYTTSQLDFAVSFLRDHPQTRLVSLMIGANDLFRLQSLCGGNASCIQAQLPNTLAVVAANLDTIFAAIRHTAHYRGQLVAVLYYSNNYADAFTTGAVRALDDVLSQHARAWGGVVADGFSAFAAASQPFGGSPCAAGLLIHVSPTNCDVHPSALGRSILGALVVAVVRHNDAKSIAG